ncbi:Sec-independent protein translocase subunit TatA [Arthrobacter gandavensis]|uniref:Sec-independent protein translocase subunit TatA n=1 Tax=Arthrobacter gandavensis TaxID=169960 RepID=UPI00188E8FD5|nr:Sec-independent protein translocase subunit TatA [Arthrobacter gandavensis]MBF4992678.1 Sec-independent protein translocase subunit TatA [Arthrobacter gandavensis]
MRLEGWHIVIIVVIAILLFGAPKLPGLARSVGQSLRIFKSEVRQLKEDEVPAKPAADPVTGAVIPPAAPAAAATAAAPASAPPASAPMPTAAAPAAPPRD